MIKTFILLKKGVVYSDEIFNFIKNVMEVRIPSEQRQTLVLNEGPELDGFRNHLKDNYNFTSRFIDNRGHSSSAFKISPLIIQVEEKYSGIFAGIESEITDAFIKGNTLVDAFLTRQYPIVPTNPPTTDTPKPPIVDKASLSPLIWVGVAAALIYALLKK